MKLVAVYLLVGVLSLLEVVPSLASELIVALLITCVGSDCSQAPAAVATMLTLSERDFSSRFLGSGQLELWLITPNNQTLYQQFLEMSTKTDQNQPLGAAGISKIGVIYSTQAPQPIQREPPVTEIPSNNSYAGVVPKSHELGTGPIIGISVSLVVVLFALLFAFSKWYMWRYAKKHNYKAQELDVRGAGETERAAQNEESVVAPRAVSFAASTRRIEEEELTGEAKIEADQDEEENLELVFDAD